MGLFLNFFRATVSLTRTGLTLCGMYTFFGYFYSKQIQHRLGDTIICDKIQRINLAKQINVSADSDLMSLYLVMSSMNLSVFYSRLWHYRKFQQTCKRFHKNVISSVLRNYEEYGVFNNMAKMEEDIRKNQVDIGLLTRILQVKELNMQLTGLFAQDFLKILQAQVQMRTGALLGLSEQQRYKINLVFNYIEKGEKFVFESQQKYWEYKMMQNQTKRHQYPTALFKLIFI